MSRPEDSLPPDLYYNDTTSRAYTTSSRIQHIQSQMTHRALALLNLAQPSFVLDIGCGSGLSGEILSDPSRTYAKNQQRNGTRITPSTSNDTYDEADDLDDDAESDIDTDSPAPQEPTTQPPSLSHTWIGIDISASMLSIARFSRNVTGDLFLSDMGHGLPFRAGTFDAAISISALQWLCTAESNLDTEQPERRLRRFFESLYVCLRRGGRAVLQFYPKNGEQTRMIGRAAKQAGFGAGVLVDDEGTKGEKMFLVCEIGGRDVVGVVEGLEGVEVDDSGRRDGGRSGRRREQKGGKGWILRKKEQRQSKGKVVKADSKYTGRKRRPKF